MADTIDITSGPRRLLVDGRDPFADEAISVSDGTIITVAGPDANGQFFVTGLLDGTATITVSPGSEDSNRIPGSDDITVITSTPPSPLVVTLE